MRFELTAAEVELLRRLGGVLSGPRVVASLYDALIEQRLIERHLFRRERYRLTELGRDIPARLERLERLERKEGSAQR